MRSYVAILLTFGAGACGEVRDSLGDGHPPPEGTRDGGANTGGDGSGASGASNTGAAGGVSGSGRALSASTPSAMAVAQAPLSPASLHTAYNLPLIAPPGQTVAIVDAYDDPNAEADLATYSATYGLPACTTANGCFRKVNENGATGPLPRYDSGWAVEPCQV